VHIYEGPNEEHTWCHLPAQKKARHYRRYFSAHSTRFVYYHHLSIILFLFADEGQLWELHCMGLYSREHTTIQFKLALVFLSKTHCTEACQYEQLNSDSTCGSKLQQIWTAAVPKGNLAMPFVPHPDFNGRDMQRWFKFW
jgi:hypothetical protein